jgi:hypothetical protein
MARKLEKVVDGWMDEWMGGSKSGSIDFLQ